MMKHAVFQCDSALQQVCLAPHHMCVPVMPRALTHVNLTRTSIASRTKVDLSKATRFTFILLYFIFWFAAYPYQSAIMPIAPECSFLSKDVWRLLAFACLMGCIRPMVCGTTASPREREAGADTA